MIGVRASSLFACAAMTVSACVPKQDEQMLATEPSSESSGDPQSPQECGDLQPSAGVYCYQIHEVPALKTPMRAVAARFTGTPAHDFIVYAFGDPFPQAGIVRWDDVAVKVYGEVPFLALTDAQQVVPVNVAGSSEPDIVWSETWTSAFAINTGGTFSAFAEIGLPAAAYETPGHTVPFDLGEDGHTEYLKGEGAILRVYREIDGTWQIDPAEFSIPGCRQLWDFTYGDFNSDGRTDLAYIGHGVSEDTEACADPALHGVMVLIHDEVGQLQALPLVSTGAHKFTRVYSGDLDGDASDDLVVLTTESEVLAFRSLGTEFAPPNTVESSLALVVADADGDGADELVLLTKEERVVKIADEVLATPKLSVIPEVIGVPLAAGDLNADGVDDLAFRQTGVDLPHLVVAISTP